MRIYSKFVMICHLCFLAGLFMRFVYVGDFSDGNPNKVYYHPIQSSVLVLGTTAILFAILLCIWVIIDWLLNKKWPVTRWIFYLNVFFMLLELFYFFY